MEEAWELAAVMLSTPIPTPVIGRLDRPIHMANFASRGSHDRMGHPIKSGDDNGEWKKHGNLPF